MSFDRVLLTEMFLDEQVDRSKIKTGISSRIPRAKPKSLGLFSKKLSDDRITQKDSQANTSQF